MTSSTQTTTDEVEIYNDDSHWGKWLPNFRELLDYRYLLRNLVARDLKVRYKNSVLGILWSLLNPLLMMVVFSLVFAVFNREGPRQYAIFFLTGLMPWNFFSGALIGGTVSIANNAALVKKVYFPREILTAAAVFSNLVNFFIGLLVLVIFLYIAGLGLTIHALWLPALIITQVIFTLGLCLLLSTLYVFYRDVMMILEVVMLAWFFLTPIIYPLDFFNNKTFIWFHITFSPAQVMRWLNPMASIIDGYRTVLWGTSGSLGPAGMDVIYLVRTFITSLLVFIVGYAVFSRYQHLFGETL